MGCVGRRWRKGIDSYLLDLSDVVVERGVVSRVEEESKCEKAWKGANLLL